MLKDLPNIVLAIKHRAISPFCTLLQYGISIQSNTGTSIEQFLAEIPAFSPEYIKGDLETIFLDGNAVDSLSTRFHKRQHTLALSAIMPGLVGAILRKNSIHARLRTTSVDDVDSKTSELSLIKLKIFNRIAQECGPKILANSVIFETSNLLKSFTQRPQLLKNILHIRRDDLIITPNEFLKTLNEFKEIRISVYER